MSRLCHLARLSAVADQPGETPHAGLPHPVPSCARQLHPMATCREADRLLHAILACERGQDRTIDLEFDLARATEARHCHTRALAVLLYLLHQVHAPGRRCAPLVVQAQSLQADEWCAAEMSSF